MTNQKSDQKLTLFGLVICAIGALFFLYDMLLLVSPSGMVHELMQKFNITAIGIGILGSVYFYSYAPMQIPGGALLDRLGPRRMLTIAGLLSVLGLVGFAYSDNFILGCIFRCIIGLATAIGYIGPMLLVSRWIPYRYFALAVGMIMLLGCFGSVMGETFVTYLTFKFGMRAAILTMASIGFLLSVIMFTLIRDNPKGATLQKRNLDQYRLRQLWLILKKPQSWLVGLVALTMWGPIAVFGSLWGISYLHVVYHISAVSAGRLVSIVWIGIALSGPFIGWFSNHIRRRRLPLQLFALVGLIAAVMILLSEHLPKALIFIALFLLGSAGSSQAVTFGLVKDNNREDYTATASGFNNMLICFGGAIFQFLVGLFISLGWAGVKSGRTDVYSLLDYQHALLILPILYSISFLVVTFLVKESYCKKTHLAEK